MSSLLSDFFVATASSSRDGEEGGQPTKPDKCWNREAHGGSVFTPIYRPLAFKAFDWTDIPLYGDSCAPSLVPISQPRITQMQPQEVDQSEQPLNNSMSTAKHVSSPQHNNHTKFANILESSDPDESLQEVKEHQSTKLQRRLPTSPVSSMDCDLWDFDSREVSFAPQVVVHSFTVVVGDHPACELPMQLGECRCTRRIPLPQDYVTMFRPMRPIPLSYEERLEVLQASTGYSEEELKLQEYEILRQE